MLVGKPILSGESDANQLEIIWDLLGSPNDDNMPGWHLLPGAQGIKPRPRHGNLGNRFKQFGTGAITLLRDLMKLDWRTRINAVDALDHPYFKMQPLPLKPHEIPTYEESHELDRRKFQDRKAALPAAPRGGTVGLGPDAHGATAGFNSEGYGRNGANGRYRDDRRPAWDRGGRGPPPSRPPPGRDDDRRVPPNRGPPRGGADVDTYIPSYEDRRPPRDERPPRDDRRQRPPREDYRRTRSRSRSPGHDRREREREVYRR